MKNSSRKKGGFKKIHLIGACLVIVFLYFILQRISTPAQEVAILDPPLEGEVPFYIDYQYGRPVHSSIFFFVVPPRGASMSKIEELKQQIKIKPAVFFHEDFDDWKRLNSTFVIITSSEAAIKHGDTLQQLRSHFLAGTSLWYPPHVYNTGMVFLSREQESIYAYNKTHSRKGWRVVVDIPHGFAPPKPSNFFDTNRKKDMTPPTREFCQGKSFCCSEEQNSAIPFFLGNTEDLVKYVTEEPKEERTAVHRLNILIELEKNYQICEYFSRWSTKIAFYGYSNILHLHHIYPDRTGPPKPKRKSFA